MARLTAAVVTPGTEDSAVSARLTHDAQDNPVTSNRVELVLSLVALCGIGPLSKRPECHKHNGSSYRKVKGGAALNCRLFMCELCHRVKLG